jgi:hypothetical protein
LTLGTGSFAAMIYINSLILALSVGIVVATIVGERRRLAAVA